MATQVEVAAHLDMGTRHLRKLQRAGVLPRARAGELDLDECRRRYLAHLAEQADAAAEGGFDLVRERARLAAVQADRVAMENAERSHQLIRLEDFRAGARSVAAAIRERIERIGEDVADVLAPARSPRECKRILDAAAREALEDLASLDVTAGAEL